MSRHRLFVVLVTAAALAVGYAHVGPPASFVVIFAFLLLCTGTPLVRAVDGLEPMPELLFGVAASVSVDAIVSEALLYAHWYTGLRALSILAAFTIGGLFWPWQRRHPPLGPVNIARRSADEPPVELDPSLPVLLVRVGRYPVYHGTVGAIRSLGRAGVPVHAIVEDKFTPAARSRYLTSAIVWPTDGSETEEYLVENLARIGKELGGGVLAIPSDDEAAVLLAEHGDELREWFLYPHVAPDLPRRLASKRGLYTVCREHDVATPYAAFPSSRRDIRTFAKRATFPVVVKNVDPWLRLTRQAVPGTTVVHSASELLDLANGFDDPTGAMFQEYIPEGEAQDWIFHTYCNARSDSLVPFTGIKLRSWPPRAGVTTYARIVRNDELAEESIRLCKEIGYRGIVDLDWRLDLRDGRYKLVDFNPRTGAQFRLFENEAGIDVVRALHLDMSGRPVPGTTPQYGRGIVVENLDLPARIAYRGGTADAPEGAARGPRPHRAWFATDDLAPFALMLVRFAKPALQRLTGGLGGRRRQRKALAAAKRSAAAPVPEDVTAGDRA